MGLRYLTQWLSLYSRSSENNQAISFAQESLGDPISGDNDWTLWDLSDNPKTRSIRTFSFCTQSGTWNAQFTSHFRFIPIVLEQCSF